MRLQLAIDYLIVFSFVIVVFILVFGSIATQRTLTATEQTFSQVQLIAQNLATQMNIAVQSGNGYYAQINLSRGLALPSYNVTFSKSGMIVVSTNVSGRIVQAIAYSMANKVSSNPSFLATNGLYVLPVGLTTVLLQNSFGTICLAYLCPVTSQQSSSIKMSQQTLHAPSFNGQGSYIRAGNATGVLDIQGPMTISAWVNSKSFPASGSWSTIVEKGYDGTNEQYVLRFTGGSGTPTLDFITYKAGTNYGITWSYGNAIVTGQWYHIVGIFDGSSWKLYLNGAQAATTSSSQAPGHSSVSVYIGASSISGSISRYFNGSISNVQIYNQSLSSSQINSLYNKGIAGSPVSNTIAGWWPLSGDANDYSGLGDQGAVHGPLLFKSVAQISAQVTNYTGSTVSNELVGFYSNLGTFSGNAVSDARYTNANGIATTYLMQNGNSGYATVKAIAFEGNLTTNTNLLGWWDIGLGEGSSLPDISTNGDTGVIYNALWGSPAHLPSFDGRSGYVNIGNKNIMSSMQQLTELAWVNIGSYSGNDMIIRKSGSYDLYVNSTGVLKSDYKSASGGVVPRNTWVLVAMSYNGSNPKLYINNVKVGSGSAGGAIGTSTTPLQIGRSEQGTQYTNGAIVNVQLYNVSLTSNQISQIFQQGITAPPIPNKGLVGWWPLSGDANDYSLNLNSGVISGGISFVPFVPKTSNTSSIYSGFFNGANAYINLSTIKTLSRFTVSTWIRYSNLSQCSSNCIIFDTQKQFALAVGSTGNTNFTIGNSGCALNSYFNGNTKLKPGVWYNVIGEYDNNGNAKLYVNGISDNSASSTTLCANPLKSYIGNSGTGSYFNGSITNVQLYNKSLSQSQITQIYNNGLDGFPVNSSVVGWWPLSGDANDYSNNGNNGANSHVTFFNTNPNITSSLKGYGMNFNGNTSVVRINNGTKINKNALTGSYTVSGWAKSLPSSWNSFAVIVDILNVSKLEGMPGTNKFCFVIFSKCTAFQQPKSFNITNWHYYTGTVNGNTISLYVDGSLVNSSSLSGTGIFTANVYIGDEYNCGSECSNTTYRTGFNGTIANIQIYNTTLSPTQINQLYNNQMPASSSLVIPLGVAP